MTTWIRAGIKWTLWLSLGVIATMALTLTMVLRTLSPAPGEWTRTVSIGPWQRELSMPAVLRVASHPFLLRLIEGRSFRTRHGVVQWQAMAAPNTWKAVCAPCTFSVGELGSEPLRFSRVELTVVPDMQMNLQGSFAIGEPGEALLGQWTSRIEAQRLLFSLQIKDEPVARAFALFRDGIPELRRAQIDGRLNVKATWSLPTQAFTFTPRVDGLRVSGLGTESLRDAQPACGPADGFGTWLPRAVIAAEDQRFHEHTGYDLAGIMAAWNTNTQQPGAMLVGASTVPQQLAKLIYTGDSRSHARKLRELLYAVEIDRTLGKARALNLYLAMVPWGHGQCGAHAAARHYLHKSPEQLAPIEAVWLATLLHNPDLELVRLAREGQMNEERVAWGADQLRPVSSRERASVLRAAKRWQPPYRALTSAMAVSASRAAEGR